MCACVKELDNSELVSSEHISFSTRLNQETKGTPLTQLDGDAGIIGYLYGEAWTGPGAPWEQLNNEKYTFSGDQLEPADKKLIKWSAANQANIKNLRVYAYAPHSADKMDISYGSEGSYTTPKITYTSPATVADQTDIITAHTDVANNFKKKIPLTFEHALTAIKFRSGFTETIKVMSIRINDVFSTGTYTIGEGWSDRNTLADYVITFSEGKVVSPGEMITDDTDDNVLFLIPQTFAHNSTAKIELEYVIEGTRETKSITLQDISWEEGRIITYTLHKKDQSTSQKVIYFDLAAGNVNISNSGYSGSIYVEGQKTDFSGQHNEDNTYYVYQSSTLDSRYNAANTGYLNQTDFNNMSGCRIPDYPGVTLSDGTSWADFITNNQVVEDVIEYWDDGANIREDKQAAPGEKHTDKALARTAGREHTMNYILVTGSGKYNLTIDDIYSALQQKVNKSDQTFRKRKIGGISFRPNKNSGADLTVNFVGDNRMGCLHIDNGPNDRITLEGTGTLTVADTDFLTIESAPGYIENDFGADDGATGGYISNFWNSAIGNNTDDGIGEKVYNLYINSGIIYAGTTKAEDCTAIGGGGNGYGQIFISGGVVTAVATTAGTAIGGGMGHTGAGGEGVVTISGGNIYAYNHATKWHIPSSAIGGGGSWEATGSPGTVNITGGNIYAYSAIGTAIGGGSSISSNGGRANVTISGGYIVAKSGEGNGIGGGSGVNGGNATIRIEGSPVIRTGSVGGGKKNDGSSGRIGSADIEISGTEGIKPDIQAQFVLAKGSGIRPRFVMSGGIIRNSDIADETYKHLQTNGGAVYLEEGYFEMSGGEIRQCLAQKGGAIYIKGDNQTTFTMSGGKIRECIASSDGGAVYLEGGQVILTDKAEISSNLAKKGNGGGVYIIGGDFVMNGADVKIINNAAFSEDEENKWMNGGSGGGIYVKSNGTNVDVDIISGTIAENSSDKVGGGISVDMYGYDNATANVTIGTADDPSMTNPSISGNHTIILGGGLYARGAKANIIINSGRIMNNTISGYEPNPNVANDGGMVTLNGGDVTSVTVTYNNNGAYYGESVETQTQVIVSATKNNMIAPVYSKTGYRFTGWNTRPDGKGVRYNNGDVLKFDTDVTLYAQWEIE